MTLVADWELISEDRPLLELLPDVPDDRRFALVTAGEGVVAWGVAARIPVGTGTHRFSLVRDELTALAGGTDLIAFASFTFDQDEDASVVVIPSVAVARRGGLTRMMTIGEPAPPSHRAQSQAAGGDRPRYGGSTVRDEDWLEAVATAVRRIEDGAYAKVVLARDLHLWSKQSFDTGRLLRELADRFPSCRTFLVDHLLGASPELLLERSGPRVRSRVLAGTAPRAADPEEDARIGAALLGSEKDRREHALALASAVESLTPFCSSLEVPASPSLVQLENVQHLGSDLVGTLQPTEQGRPPHVLDLLDALHPTAAVGGTPHDAALRAIRSLEGMSRGRYAGPVGWCTPDGDGEFAIALRCAEVRGDRARLFAGAGIVAGSLPEAELTETWLKLRAMTGVLDR